MADNAFLDDYKKYKNISSNNNDDDSLLNQTLDAVEDYFQKQYFIYLEKKTFDYTVSGKNNSLIALPTYYLSISDVKLGGKSIKDDTYLEDNILFYTKGIYTKGYGNLVVSADWGFDSGQVPKSLLEAFLILSDKYYENAKQNLNTIGSYNDPMNGGMKLVSTLPKTYYTLLQPHIVENIG